METLANNDCHDYSDYCELFNLLLEYHIAIKEELELLTYINGWKIKILNNVLFIRTGYIDLDQFKSHVLNKD